MGTVGNMTAIWGDHDKLEERAERSLMKIKDNTMQQSRLGSSAEKDPEFLVDKLKMSP